MTALQRWFILITVYSLFLGIGVSAILAVLGFIPNVHPRFVDWAVGVLLVDVVAAALTV